MQAANTYGQPAMRRANTVIAIVAGALALLAWTYLLNMARTSWSVPPTYLAFAITVTAVASLAWTLVCISHARGDGETRCRSCGYILRGLTEPRCPECGERI